MKKKILTFMLSLCFILPCAFLVSACGSEPEPTLNGYTLYIKGEETTYFETVYGNNAITADDIRIKSDWSDSSKNAFVPITDFKLSVSWTDENSEEQTTLPNFWTEQTTVNDLPTGYTFRLTNDNAELLFYVNIGKREYPNTRVLVQTPYGGTTNNARIQWHYNSRNYDEANPDAQYTLVLAGVEEGYSEHVSFRYVESSAYDALETEQEKKELVQQATSSSGWEVFEEDPGTYYAFAWMSDSDYYKYGEQGYIYNYATINIVNAAIEQKPQTNVYNFSEHSHDFSYESAFYFGINYEIDLVGDVSGVDFYAYNGSEWGVVELKSPEEETFEETTLKVNAIKEHDKYVLVDYYSSGWYKVNTDGTRGEALTGDEVIECVEYTKIQSYIDGTSIKVPVNYMVNEVVNSTYGFHYDCSKKFKTYITLNKWVLEDTPEAEHIGYAGIIVGHNSFEFTYEGESFVDEIEDSFNRYGNIDLFEFINADETEVGYHQGYIRLKNPNHAWVNYDDNNKVSSSDIRFDYRIKYKQIGMPHYGEEDNECYEQFDSPIEFSYKANGNYDFYIRGTDEGVASYHYKLTEAEVELYRAGNLDKSDLIETIRQGEKDANVNYDVIPDNWVANHTPGIYVVMYDLESRKNTIWEDLSTDARVFLFEILKTEQRPYIVDHYDFTITTSDVLGVKVGIDGTVDLSEVIIEKQIDDSYYYGTESPIVLEVVDRIPNTEIETTGSGTFENNIITITVNESTTKSPLGIFCIKITKSGNECYDDFVLYVPLEVFPEQYNVLNDYCVSLFELDNYVEQSDTYQYDGLLFAKGQKFSEVAYLPNLPTSEYGTYSWAIRYSNDYYVKVTDETTFTDFVYDMVIIFTANDGMEWFIEDSGDDAIDGVAHNTGYGIRFYTAEPADLSGETLEIDQIPDLDWIEYKSFSSTYNDGNKDYSVEMTLGEFVEAYYNTDLMKGITGVTEISSVQDAKTALKSVYREFVLANNPIFKFSEDGTTVTTYDSSDTTFSEPIQTYTLKPHVLNGYTEFWLMKEGNNYPQGTISVYDNGEIGASVVGFTLRQFIYMLEYDENVTLTATDGSGDTVTVPMNELNNPNLQLVLPYYTNLSYVIAE